MEKLHDETWKNDMERDASLYEADQVPEKEDDDWQLAHSREFIDFFSYVLRTKKGLYFSEYMI